MKTIVAVVAAALLAGIDYLILVAAFLGNSQGTEFIPIAMIIGLIAAVAFRQKVLVHAVQSIITILFIVTLIRTEPLGPASETATASGMVILGHVLAWMIARAIPQQRVSGLASNSP